MTGQGAATPGLAHDDAALDDAAVDDAAVDEDRGPDEHGAIGDVYGDRPGTLDIGDLYDRVEDALARAFPRSDEIWVRGEVQSFSDRTGHCYMDLVDPETSGERNAPVLKVKCWRSSWSKIRQELGQEGIELVPGTVVVLRGSVDFYRPRAELGFILQELDVTALLGRLAAQRAALIRALGAEGLLERNAALALAPVPVRIGLVASPGTEGYRDFLGQLEEAGLAFSVQVAQATVQGQGAPPAIARAVQGLGRAGVDLIVVVRGGGSKSDLAAFDSEAVARAIAMAPVPVWTGIGHTGDESVADLVAHRACITPTGCGQALADLVASWAIANISWPAARLSEVATTVLADRERRSGDARHRLATTARQQVRWHGERLAGRVATIRASAPLLVEASERRVGGQAARLAPLALGHLAHADTQMGSWRRLLAAYDVQRQLERGYSLTSGPDGRVVRSARAVEPGSELVTRFADGSVRSVVTARDGAPADADMDAGRPTEPEREER